MTGLCVGLPVGCIMRERGYVNKLRNAYAALRPEEKSKSSSIVMISSILFGVGFGTDNLDKLLSEKKVRQFHQDLQNGLAKPEDFERYIYGGNYDRKVISDDRDRAEDKVRDQIKQWEEESQRNIEISTGKAVDSPFKFK